MHHSKPVQLNAAPSSSERRAGTRASARANEQPPSAPVPQQRPRTSPFPPSRASLRSQVAAQFCRAVAIEHRLLESIYCLSCCIPHRSFPSLIASVFARGPKGYRTLTAQEPRTVACTRREAQARPERTRCRQQGPRAEEQRPVPVLCALSSSLHSLSLISLSEIDYSSFLFYLFTDRQ